MDNLDNFKQFAKNNPKFASYIKDGSMTWQKFYELYDMYGEDSTVWDEYKQEKKKSTTLNDIVAHYGGGGHNFASGAKNLTLNDIESVNKELVERLKEIRG